VTLVDTNVLLDVITADPVWSGWSRAELRAAAARGDLLINLIVYAELSVRFISIAEVDLQVQQFGLLMQDIPVAALFLAGKVAERYRRSGGRRTGVLPDFFLGAHAFVTNQALLTRDVRRYRTYFPEVRLIAPDP
jgi:predicted nucleic acid-binding protein